jgi:hypothetical protein
VAEIVVVIIIIRRRRRRIIINTKNVHTDRCGNTSRRERHAKGRRKEAKMQEFMYGDTTDVEYEISEYTGNNRCHRNSKKRFKEKFESHTKKHPTDSLQKQTIRGTSYVSGRVLRSEA